MEQLLDQSLAAFAEMLSSSEPTPGGGGAAALCGALAAALCAMASRLTAGRKKYADRAEELSRIVCRADEIGREQGKSIDFFASSNIDGGDEINEKYIQQYKPVIPGL